ncbi:DUF6510 family protein [Isoptericola cucumis]|uniref:Uncharacterized protein n=1 Tax=Isoptericola cucumis TaxID=1776856 RepID=A0ABQ2B9D4_9MICO|nr:DUF6510 family protein [Isoptericola cucumis]GGI11117.1 hypothetical protein GCM10007368_34610 [Isoptericola cucumis]
MDRPAHDAPLDGNAVAGLLGEAFAFETTLALVRCATCGRTDVVARARAHVSAMGAIVRCDGCDAVLLVVVERPDGTLVSTRGAAWLRAPRPADRPY